MVDVKRRGTIVPHHYATDWGGLIDDSEVPASPCPRPAISDLRTRFPEFAGYSDVQVGDALDDASCWADTSWTSNCGDCTKAILFLAAHYLYMQAKAAAALPLSDGAGGFIEGGQLKMVGFEGMRVAFSAPQAAGGMTSNRLGNTGEFDYSGSPYGQRYLDLLKVNVPAVLVI